MRLHTLLAVLPSFALFPTTRAWAQETAVRRTDLPAAVQHTVTARSAGAVVKGFTRETEHGQTFYEAEMTVNGRSRDLLMDQQGKVVEIEEEVAVDSLPAAVRSALRARAEGGTIERVESLTRQGRLVAYEAVVKTGARRREIQVGPAGEALHHEE